MAAEVQPVTETGAPAVRRVTIPRQCYDDSRFVFLYQGEAPQIPRVSLPELPPGTFLYVVPNPFQFPGWLR